MRWEEGCSPLGNWQWLPCFLVKMTNQRQSRSLGEPRENSFRSQTESGDQHYLGRPKEMCITSFCY